MAFLYDAGLRIRLPEPLPECMPGESVQDWFARAMSQCSIESATTAENTSGDSAPSPFNLGQLQSDLAQATLAIEGLGTNSGEQQVEIDALTDGFASGVVSYALGATTALVTLPSDGVWHIGGIAPLEQALAAVKITFITENSFTVNFTATLAAGSFHYIARKAS